MSKRIKGQIGYVSNKNLPGLEHLKGGHYVYIRDYDKQKKTCKVNVITSLEEKPKVFSKNKIIQVRKGNTYPIPYYDANFTKWSGITKNPIENVRVDDIKNIGSKKMKKRHKFYVGKYFE